MKYNLQVYLPFASASVQGVDLCVYIFSVLLLLKQIAKCARLYSVHFICTEMRRVRKVIAVMANVSID